MVSDRDERIMLREHKDKEQRKEEQARQGGELLYMQFTKYDLAQRKTLPSKQSEEIIPELNLY